MAAEVNKCSLENMLNAILGVANQEQNMSYPASIFTSQYNTVTSLLLSKLADIYPSDPSVLDMLDPFVERDIIRPISGYINLPDNYRNILGTPMISAKEDGCAECVPEGDISNAEFKKLNLKAGCKKVNVLMVDQAEFADRTTSTYKKPTYAKPIGYRSGTVEGKGQIKVCPFDINAVEVMYVRKEKLVNYGYIMQPDDTFVFNAETSVESEWTSAAFQPIFKALFALYTAYSRDNQLRDWALFINQNSLV